MSASNDLLCAGVSSAAAALVGAFTWYGVVLVTSESEAFDVGAYFLLVPVASGLVCLIAGLFSPKTTLLPALAFTGAHIVAGFTTMGFGGMWPVSILFMALPTMPGYLVAGGYTLWWAARREPSPPPPRLPSPPIPCERA